MIKQVIGGLGLSNCLLGSVALSEVLIMIIQEGRPAEPLMKIYSDERRQAFQFLIDPVSSWISPFCLPAPPPPVFFFFPLPSLPSSFITPGRLTI